MFVSIYVLYIYFSYINIHTHSYIHYIFYTHTHFIYESSVHFSTELDSMAVGGRYLHSALLCKKELHWPGSWLSLYMTSRVIRICLNMGLSLGHKAAQSDATFYVHGCNNGRFAQEVLNFLKRFSITTHKLVLMGSTQSLQSLLQVPANIYCVFLGL